MMSTTTMSASTMSASASQRGDSQRPVLSTVKTVLSARGLRKTFGRVVALDDADFDLRPGEVLAVIGDNGAGKSTLIKALTGALAPDGGELFMDDAPVFFRSPLEARLAGIETVHQNLAVAPALDVAENLFLGRERRAAGFLGKWLRMLDWAGMHREAAERMAELGLLTLRSTRQAVETLSGGQRQGVAVARAVTFGGRVVVMDEPTAALGVKESGRVLAIIGDLRARGLSVILISHNMPHVWEVADRIHIHRLGKRAAVVTPHTHSMTDGVAIMTGAATA